MSLFFRAPEPEQRAVRTIEWGTGADLDRPSSASEALSVVPVFAACRLISDSIATLPMQAFVKKGDARQPIDLPSVFDKETRIEWLQQAVMSLLLHGNAYGLVTQRDNGARPQSVIWLNPERVSVNETSGSPVFSYNGAQIDPANLKHIPAYSVPGTVVGVSPIGACSLLTSTGTATQKMMKDWFAGRAVPGVTLQNNEKTLDPQQAAQVAERLRSRLRNGQPFVHGKDWDLNVLKMPAEDAGFVASAKLNATQVASIYGIPPEMIGGETGSSLTYSTVELNLINFATFTLRPWLVKLEQEFSAWSGADRFVRFNVDAMIRVDTKTRYDVHKIAREIGLNNIDELRALEDEAPLPNGQGTDYTPLPALSKPEPTPAARSFDDPATAGSIDARTNVHMPKIEVDARSTIVMPEAPVTFTDNRENLAPNVQITNQIDVEPTPLEVKVTNDVQPADVKVIPAEPKKRRIERDSGGNIVAVTEEP